MLTNMILVRRSTNNVYKYHYFSVLYTNIATFLYCIQILLLCRLLPDFVRGGGWTPWLCALFVPPWWWGGFTPSLFFYSGIFQNRTPWLCALF